MLTVDQALEKLLAAAKPVKDTETIPLMDALGRVLAAPVVSTIDVPPADNSAMDGYAIAAASLASATTLPVSQRIPAGHPSAPLQSGTAARIFTGGQIPAGADTIVMQENCNSSDDGKTVTFLTPVKAGQHIRKRGEDITAGSELFSPGHRIDASDLGVIASIGLAQVSVYRTLRVGIISSGDELLNPGEPTAPGKIYNSNRFTLKGLLDGLRCTTVDFGHVADHLEETTQALQNAASQVDVLISTGGVSVGEEDHIKQAVSNLGELSLWKLAIKPGKPLAFGRIGQTPFFGLPGNPVSTFITFQIIARPYLLKTQGQTTLAPTPLPLVADFSFEKNETRQEYLRVRIHGDKVTRYKNQSSGALSSTSWANALAVIPPNTSLEPGDRVMVIPYAYFKV